MRFETQNLEVHYGRVRVLHGASLELGHKLLAVVGCNGMDKTTFCHGIMGLANVIAGNITLDGVPLQGIVDSRTRLRYVSPSGGTTTEFGRRAVGR